MKVNLMSRNLAGVIAVMLIVSSCGKKSALQGDTVDATTDYVYQRIDEIARNIKFPEVSGDTIDMIKFSGLHPDISGTKDFRPAFERAVREIERRGGGVIYFRHTSGKQAWVKETDVYRFSGPMDLTSNLAILLDPSIEIRFDTIRDNFMNEGDGVITRYEGTTIYGYSPLVRAFNKENIIIKAVKGNGAQPVISGNGEHWQSWARERDIADMEVGETPGYIHLREVNNQNIPLRERRFTNMALRPDLVQFFMCRNVLMDGIFLKESPFWVVHSVFSENLVFRNLLYDAQVVNNDGIDVESSKNVLIENVIFNNHDDNIVIKSGRDQEGMFGVDITGTVLEDISSPYIERNRLGGKTENVAVRNCVFHGHHAVCIGSEMSGGASDIYIADCFSPQYVYMALYLKGSRKRGGEVHDIYMVNSRFNNVLNDVVGLVPNYDGDTTSLYPSWFHDIYLHGVKVKRANYGIRSLGWPDREINDVYIRDLEVAEVVNAPFIIRQSRNIRLENTWFGGMRVDTIMHHHDELYMPARQN